MVFATIDTIISAQPFGIGMSVATRPKNHRIGRAVTAVQGGKNVQLTQRISIFSLPPALLARVRLLDGGACCGLRDLDPAPFGVMSILKQQVYARLAEYAGVLQARACGISQI